MVESHGVSQKFRPIKDRKHLAEVRGALPEVAGGAALTLPNLDTRELRIAMENVKLYGEALSERSVATAQKRG